MTALVAPGPATIVADPVPLAVRADGVTPLAVAPPELVTVIATGNVSTMEGGIEMETESAAGSWICTGEELALGELTVLPFVPSVPDAVPVNATVPTLPAV